MISRRDLLHIGYGTTVAAFGISTTGCESAPESSVAPAETVSYISKEEKALAGASSQEAPAPPYSRRIAAQTLQVASIQKVTRTGGFAGFLKQQTVGTGSLITMVLHHQRLAQDDSHKHR